MIRKKKNHVDSQINHCILKTNSLRIKVKNKFKKQKKKEEKQHFYVFTVLLALDFNFLLKFR